MRSRRFGIQGVALLEVLLATTIVGIGMGAVFRSFSDSARIQSLLQRKATARALAEDKFDELRVTGALAQIGQSSGQYEPPNDDYFWSLLVQPASDGTGTSRLRLAVLYGEKKELIHSLSTYRFTP